MNTHAQLSTCKIRFQYYTKFGRENTRLLGGRVYREWPDGGVQFSFLHIGRISC